jgi:SAM-dependent methyltransferase
MKHDKTLGRAVDVGCGPNPVEGCDAYTDAYPDSPVSRSGGVVSADLPNFHTAPIEQLPFRDGDFDFSYCRHVLEHVEQPAVAIAELERISRAGYIETPSYWNEIAFGKRYHRWMVLLLDGVLHFIPKTPATDRPFGDFLIRAFEQTDEGRRLRASRDELFVNVLYWRGNIPFSIH